jgi:hypothetical protein
MSAPIKYKFEEEKKNGSKIFNRFLWLNQQIIPKIVTIS